LDARGSELCGFANVVEQAMINSITFFNYFGIAMNNQVSLKVSYGKAK
jgi:hypothetical protein